MMERFSWDTFLQEGGDNDTAWVGDPNVSELGECHFLSRD